MRPTYRAAGLLALAVAAITCTDAPTGPGAHRPGFTGAQLALAPSFSPAAERALTALEAMGISVTQVRIRLSTMGGALTRDTTIQFGAADTLHIHIPIEIQGSEQTFSALIELLDASGTVLFSRTQNVTARATMLPAAPPPTITLEYVGPGASARSLAVTPTDVNVQAGVHPVLTAVGTDAAGSPVTNLLLGWTSSDTTLATVTAVGRLATVHGTGRRGVVTITAMTPTGLTGSARLTMLPLAARLAVISGDAQTSIAGRLLAQPLVVELQGADGGPIPDATVTFRAVTTGAAVGSATATTDAAGRASTTLTLGRTAGAYAFEATSGALAPTTITATATAAPAIALALVGGNAQVDSVGAVLALPFTVRATDEYGATVAGASITWERLAGLGTLGATATATGADGVATTSYRLGLVPSADTLRATITGATGAAASVPFTTKSIARGANAIAITGGGRQSGLPGATLAAPLVAVVTDALGSRLPGVSVQWRSSVAGLVTFATPVAVTDANGEARTAVSLGAAAGTTTVTANVGALLASTTLAVTVGPAANLVAVAGSGPGIVGGTTLLKARVTDAAGNPVSGHTVSWAVTTGGGSLPLTSSTTNALGEAEITWTLGFVVGAQTATATASGLTGSPALFTVDAVTGAGALLRLTTQPGAPAFNAPSGVVLTTQPVVQLTDASGASPIRQAGVVVTATLTNALATLRGTPTAVTDAAGVATFAGLNILGVTDRRTAMSFAAAGYTSVTSNPLTIGPGVAASMVAQTASTSGTVGLPVSLAPSVLVKDSTGNAVPGVRVTFAVASGGGSISNPDAITDAGGVATAGSWVLGSLVGANVVTGTSGTLGGSPVRFTANGTAAAVQVGSIRLLAGRNQLVPIRGTLPADSVAFVVNDVNAKPLGGVSVSFRLGTLSQCSIAQRTPLVTGADGVASTAVTAGAQPGPCEVTALAGNAQATSKIAVHGDGVTHVWFGGTIGVERNFDVASNWLNVLDRKALAPLAGDVAFVPNWDTNMGPQLLADAALRGLALSPSAIVDLNKFTLTTTGSVSAAQASISNGLVIAGGAVGTRLSGRFDRLDVGRLAFCASDAATLDTLVVTTLHVICTADVGTQAEILGSVDVGTSASFTIKGALIAKSPALMRLFDNVSLIVNGTATIGSCTQTIGIKPSINVRIGGTGTINGLLGPFLGFCLP